MKARIVLLLFWAVKSTTSQRVKPITKGSIAGIEKVSSQRTRLLSKSEKGEKSRNSEKGESSGNGKPQEQDAGSAIASAEEEKPVMIIVPPLKMSNVSEASTETEPTSEPSAEENTVSLIGQPEDPPSLENATQMSPTEPPVEETKMQCPMPGYLEYVIPDKPFFRYPHTRGNASFVFSVTDTCSYIIEAATGEIVRKSSPLEWLDASVFQFGGAPRSRQGNMLTGLDAPSHINLDMFDRGASVYEIVIDGNSASVAGNNPIAWIFFSEAEAKDFEYFVASLIRYAPAIFLTNDSSACASGPFCSIIGNAICYHDPKNSSLGIIHLNGDEDVYSDSFEWLGDCLGVLECSKIGEGAFSYSSCPTFEVNGTIFSFTEENPADGVSFQCPTENAVQLVAEMVQMLSVDPFHALEIGAPEKEYSSSHETNSTGM